MATFAIGDIQGCFQTLQALLKKLPWDPGRDRLWLVGDLINRGPRSLEVLRWAREQSSRLTMVLGNHELHLIARAMGLGRPKKSDTIQPILEAPESGDLIAWLRDRPLLHREGNVVMVHAGLHPAWSISEAESLAREAEAALSGPKAADLINSLYASTVPIWNPNLSGIPRLQATLKILTSIRIIAPNGSIPFQFKGPPAMAPLGYLPWFAVPTRKSAGATVVCGHWASLGLKFGTGLMALDSGCVYGRELTAVCLEDQAVFQQSMLD